MKIKLAAAQLAKLRQYVRARRIAAETNATIENLKAEILSIVKMSGGRVDILNATCFRGESVSYLYPKSILNREEKLRGDKKLAQLTGKAQKQVKDCLMFQDLAKAKGQ